MKAEARSSKPLFILAAVIVLASAGCSSTDEGGTTAQGQIDAPTLKILAENRGQVAAGLSIENPPDVQPVRLVEPDEWATTQIECLTEAGYEVSYTDDMEGVTYPAISETALAESLNLAIYTCESQYPVSPKYTAPLSRDQLVFLYAYRGTDLVECLHNAGYSPDDAPSEAVFIESDGAWDPYESISVAQDELSAVREVCPVNPDFDELYAQ